MVSAAARSCRSLRETPGSLAIGRSICAPRQPRHPDIAIDKRQVDLGGGILRVDAQRPAIRLLRPGVIPHQVARHAKIVQRRGVARVMLSAFRNSTEAAGRVVAQAKAPQTHFGADRCAVALQRTVVAGARLIEAAEVGERVALHDKGGLVARIVASTLLASCNAVCGEPPRNAACATSTPGVKPETVGLRVAAGGQQQDQEEGDRRASANRGSMAEGMHQLDHGRTARD